MSVSIFANILSINLLVFRFSFLEFSEHAINHVIANSLISSKSQYFLELKAVLSFIYNLQGSLPEHFRQYRSKIFI
jgi:hypothetical protein